MTRFRLARMTGRDPAEPGRGSSPLELLFDLTFVVAVGTAAANFADTFAEGHLAAAFGALMLALFAICVSWINFSWFASGFGTDDWLDRVLTMVQMIGVVVLAIGIPPMFESVVAAGRVEFRLIVVGYVVMRAAMILQWLRVSRQSPVFRKVAAANAVCLILLQVGWVVLALARPRVEVTLVVAIVLGALELLAPVAAQGRANGTPWHPHHMAERYSAFVIIGLGEGVVGTVSSLGGLLGGDTGLQWSGDAVAVAAAGVALTFGLWWLYFSVDFGEVLARRPHLGYLFGYGHLPVFFGIAGAGAGVHILGITLDAHADIGPVTTVAALVVPVAVYVLGVVVLYALLAGVLDRVRVALTAVTLLVFGLAIGLAVVGVPVAICLLVVTAAPFVSVAGSEVARRA